MPVSWTLDPASRRAVLTLTDPYTFQEWESAVTEILHDPAFSPPYNFLVDRRHATAPSAEFARRMSDFFAEHAPDLGRSRAAVIVSSDVAFGVGRMAQALTEARNPAITMRIFRNDIEAERWLAEGG